MGHFTNTISQHTSLIILLMHTLDMRSFPSWMDFLDITKFRSEKKIITRLHSQPMGYIHLSSNALWSEEHWSHLPAHHDTLFPRPHPHHVGLPWQPHFTIIGVRTTQRRLATNLPTMLQVQNMLEPFQLCFLCPNGLSPRVHHVTQRNDHWSPRIPNHFPSNIASLSDVEFIL